MEHHAMHRDFWLQLLEQVPGNRFAFSVFVGCEIESVGALQNVFEFANNGATTLGELIRRLEIVVDINSQTLAGKVGNMAHGGADFELWSEVLGDRFGLGRGLNDDE